MKKSLIVCMAVFCIGVFFSACYNEIEPEPPSARAGLLPIAGAFNVRDVAYGSNGKLTGVDGKAVKSGILIRSGDLSMLNARDERFLFGETGIKTVVDFRSTVWSVDSDWNVSNERLNNPGRVPAGIIWDSDKGKPSTAIPESIVIPDYETILRDDKYDDPNEVLKTLQDGYRKLINDSVPRGAYHSFFLAVIDAIEKGHPILYHCSAGKDRAGVASALLLKALGVSNNDIIDNYMLSEENVAEKYAPVVPFIGVSVTEELLQMRRLAQAVAMGEPAAGMATAGLRASLEQGIRQRRMAGALNASQSAVTDTLIATTRQQMQTAPLSSLQGAETELVFCKKQTR